MLRSRSLSSDMSIPGACLLLFGAGLSAIYSVSLAQGAGWAGKQLLWGSVAAGGAAVMLCCSLSALRRSARALALLSIAGLLAAFFFEPRNGAHRWISWGGFSVQPSEFCKLTALLIAAHYASRPQYKRRQMEFVLPVMGWLALFLIPVALQRDFGGVMLIAFAGLAVLFLSGLDMKWVCGLAIAAAVAGLLLVLMEPYRLRRVSAFVDPFADGSGAGYNQKHALIAFAMGGFWGRGAERSIEKWGYLPESHNDFIIAIIGEEWGLAGFFLVCGLLAYVAARALKIGGAAAARGETFGALYSYGFAAMLAAQSFVNIGGSLALMPFKGFTLPFVSYGGSSLAATGMMLGALMRVDLENRRAARIERGWT